MGVAAHNQKLRTVPTARHPTATDEVTATCDERLPSEFEPSPGRHRCKYGFAVPGPGRRARRHELPGVWERHRQPSFPTELAGRRRALNYAVRAAGHCRG